MASLQGMFHVPFPRQTKYKKKRKIALPLSFCVANRLFATTFSSLALLANSIGDVNSSFCACFNVFFDFIFVFGRFGSGFFRGSVVHISGCIFGRSLRLIVNDFLVVSSILIVHCFVFGVIAASKE